MDHAGPRGNPEVTKWPEPQVIISYMIVAMFGVAFVMHYNEEMNDALVTAFAAVVGYSVGLASAGRRSGETK